MKWLWRLVATVAFAPMAAMLLYLVYINPGDDSVGWFAALTGGGLTATYLMVWQKDLSMHDPYLDELPAAQLRSLRIQGFVRFLVDMAQIATPILLFLILWKMG